MKITKGLLLALLIVACSTFSANAQKYVETVYLKNGSIISGTIIEEIPGQSLKIKTNDGNIFVCELSGVAKITKGAGSLANQNKSLASQQTSGYKGFVDLGYSIGVGDYDINRLEFSTSHGYQFNPYLYLGAGAGISYFHEPDEISFPLFANPRFSIPTGQAALPFLDIKVGYTVGKEAKGFYFNPSLGARFGLNNESAINFSFGYTLQNIDAYSYSYYNGYYSERVNIGAITFKLGYEF